VPPCAVAKECFPFYSYPLFLCIVKIYLISTSSGPLIDIVTPSFSLSAGKSGIASIKCQ
jgi:hypothetical protein